MMIKDDEIGENEEGSEIYIYRMKSARKTKWHPRLETGLIRLSHVSKQLIKAARGITHKCPLFFR